MYSLFAAATTTTTATATATTMMMLFDAALCENVASDRRDNACSIPGCHTLTQQHSSSNNNNNNPSRSQQLHVNYVFSLAFFMGASSFVICFCTHNTNMRVCVCIWCVSHVHTYIEVDSLSDYSSSNSNSKKSTKAEQMSVERKFRILCTALICIAYFAVLRRNGL